MLIFLALDVSPFLLSDPFDSASLVYPPLLASLDPSIWSFPMAWLTAIRTKNNFNTQKNFLNFPGGTVDRNPPANAGDMGLIPGPGRFHMPWSKPMCHNY